jgi:hypothetical protein
MILADRKRNKKCIHNQIPEVIQERGKEKNMSRDPHARNHGYTLFGHSNDPFTTCVHVPKITFLHDKSDWISLLKNNMKQDSCRLHYTQDSTMLDCRILS